jgi:UDP-3-O-[3-hydroxymyristoyl] glucosamine N-acyltransferase
MRRQRFEKLIGFGLEPINVINKSSLIQPETKIGNGVQIHPSAIINSYTDIVANCIANTGVIVEYDDVLKVGVEVGSGATVCE